MIAHNALVLGVMTFLFLALGYLGVPVAFSLIAGVLVGTATTPITYQSIIGQLFNGIDSEAPMAIPFFLLVGELMTSANVVIRIAGLPRLRVDLADALPLETRASRRQGFQAALKTLRLMSDFLDWLPPSHATCARAGRHEMSFWSGF